jgi:hypothetical protein
MIKLNLLPGAVNGAAQPVGHGEQQHPTPEIKITGPMASRNSGMICSSEVGGISIRRPI